MTYLSYSKETAMKNSALSLFMFAFWIPLFLLITSGATICVLDFLYFQNLVPQVRSLTLVNVLYVFLPLLGLCILSIFIWRKGYKASLHAYAINHEENAVYSIAYDKGIPLAVTIFLGSQLADDLTQIVTKKNNNIGETGEFIAAGILVYNFFAARKFLSDKNNLAITLEHKDELPIAEMKDWKVISTNNKKTQIRGTVLDRKGNPKSKTWTIYNIYENYGELSKGGVSNA